MGIPAANIDEAIANAAFNVHDTSVDAAKSLLTQLDVWVASMFPAAGLVGNDNDRGVRTVRDWFAATLLARREVVAEGAGNTDTTILSESPVSDALTRSLWAVKFATIDGNIAAGVEANVVTAFNTAWA